MSTSAPLSIPLHFASASTSKGALTGPSVPKDWRYRWHRTDFPRRRSWRYPDSRTTELEYDDYLQDDDIDRWITCMAAWSDEGDSDDRTDPGTLQISVADENGISIASDAQADSFRTRKSITERRQKGAGVAIGTHEGTVWLFRESFRKDQIPEEAHLNGRRKSNPTSSSSTHQLKSPVSSVIHHSNVVPELEGFSAAVAETSDVNATASATRNSTAIDAEERLETQWHAGKEHHTVLGGVMEAFGLHQSEKNHSQPHTHPHTQSSSELPSGSSTPASPPYKRKVKKDLSSPLSPTASSVSVSAFGRSRNGSAVTLMDQWERESTNSDAESQHRRRLSNLMGSSIQRKTSRASVEAHEVPLLAEAVKSLEVRQASPQQKLGKLQPFLVLQPSASCTPMVALTRVGSDQLASLQEDGNLTIWSLSEARELRFFNVNNFTPPSQEVMVPSSTGNSPLVNSAAFTTLAGLRSNTNSPAPDRSRTNSNATHPSKAMLDTFPHTGISRIHSASLIAGSRSGAPILLCYDDVKGRVLLVDVNSETTLTTYSPLHSRKKPPAARMNSDGESVDLYYINTKNEIILHIIELPNVKAEAVHIETAKRQGQLSSASAFFRREGYSNVPSKAPSIAEEKSENLELGNGGIEQDILGLKLINNAVLILWTMFDVHILRRLDDSLLAVGTVGLANVENIEIEADCICIETDSDLLTYTLDKDLNLVLVSKESMNGGTQLQAYSILYDGMMLCSIDAKDRLDLMYKGEKLWQQPEETGTETTIRACLPYSMERIVLSLSSGHLVMSSLADLVTGNFPEAPKGLMPHSGVIKSLQLIINPRTQARHVVGGTEEGDIIFWDATTLKLQSQKSSLTGPVVDMIVFGKDDNTLRLNGCLACLSADGALVVFALDGLNELYTIPGRGVPMRELAVRTNELLLLYEDGRARVWDMKTLELRRSIGIDQAQALVDDGKGWWSRHAIDSTQLKVESGSAGVLSSLPCSRDAIVGTMNANLRRAIEAASRMVLPSNKGAAALAQSLQDDIDDIAATSTIEERMAAKINASVSISTPNGKKAVQTLRPLMQALMPLGLSDDIDALCKILLDTSHTKTTKWIHSGTSSSSISLVLATKSIPSAHLLSISPAITTIRLLGLSSMLLITSNISELKIASLELLTLLGNIADIIGEEYKYPCLALLAEYINDSAVEIRQAAENLFTTTLEAMSQDKVEEICERWSHQLPIRDTLAAEAHKAVMLLGLIATQRYTVLPPALLKDIANSIAMYLHDDANPSRQMEAIFLCDRGFSIFQHYFDAMDVMRTLFSLSVSKQQDTKDEASTSPATTEARSLARRATLRVSEENTPLFMTTLSMDILHAQSPAHCNATMRLVALIVRKKPLILYPNLPRLAEAVVKSLDPTVTSMRTVIHRSATIIISELVATYPTIAFHKELQRLAVGTFEGAIIMYDLKTSTRLYVIEAHHSSLSGLSFSQDGRRLISICLHDSKVKVWKTGVGFSSFLNFGGAPRQGGLLSVASSSSSLPGSAAMAPSKSTSSIISAKALYNIANASTPPSPNPAAPYHESSGGTNAYKTFEFGRVMEEDEVKSPTKENARLDLIKFNWVANRSVKIDVGLTNMSFDVN